MAGNGAFPDQFVEPCLILIEVAGDILRAARDLRWADRFVRFLGVLGFGFVLANEGRDVLGRIFFGDHRADRCDRFRRDRHAVRSHVGDEADRVAADVDALVQALGDLHRLLGGKSQLAGSIHLQRRGLERCVRVAFDGLLLDVGDFEVAVFDGRFDRGGGGFVLYVELVEALASDGAEAGFELFVLGGFHHRVDGPVFVGAEGFDLGFAVAHEAQGDGLHAAGRTRSWQLAPQHGRERKADEIIERAARQIGFHQRLVDLARVFQCRQDRLFGNRVEGDALDFEAFAEHLAVVQDLQNVPGDGFALAIRVCCQDQLIGALHRVGDVFHHLLAAILDVPMHGEIVVWLDRAVFGWQIADMADRGDHLIVGAEILIDGFRLGGGFDDNDVHMGLSLNGRSTGGQWQRIGPRQMRAVLSGRSCSMAGEHG